MSPHLQPSPLKLYILYKCLIFPPTSTLNLYSLVPSTKHREWFNESSRDSTRTWHLIVTWRMSMSRGLVTMSRDFVSSGIQPWPWVVDRSAFTAFRTQKWRTDCWKSTLSCHVLKFTLRAGPGSGLPATPALCPDFSRVTSPASFYDPDCGRIVQNFTFLNLSVLE
jgi:hypothetical protein